MLNEPQRLCEYCGQLPHHPRCPNAPDPQSVYICSGCGRSICEGDHVWHLMGEQWCEDCVDNAREEAVYDPY